jgi:hypothetical protein
MAQTIRLKRSAVANKVPTTGDLNLGELAINTYDGKLYLKKDSGTASIVEVGAGGGGGGGTFYQQTTAPTSFAAGDRWYDTTNGKLFTAVTDNSSTIWVEFPGGTSYTSSSSSVPDFILFDYGIV